MVNFIQKITGKPNSSSSCCGVEIKEVKEQEVEASACCGTSESGNNESCCG